MFIHRLAVLLYAPALTPALNSLIAQQNRQTSPASSAPSLEGRSDDPTLTRIFRLFDEQRAVPNLSAFAPIGSERVSSALTAETDTESYSMRAGEAVSASPFGQGRAPIPDAETRRRARQQCGREARLRLTSALDPVRLDGSVFTPEDFWTFEEHLRAAEKRPENVRSLSTRGKNEIVTRECFRDWLRRLLRQLDGAHGASGSERPLAKETGRAERASPSRTTLDEATLRGTERRRSADRFSTSDQSPDSSRDNGGTPTEHEEDDSDDQKSFTSAASTNSARSLRVKQDDVIDVVETEESRNERVSDSIK